MTVHNPSSHEECLKLDPTSIFNDQMARLRMVQNPESSDRGHAQSTWHHPLSGMDAGYYSYLRYVGLKLPIAFVVKITKQNEYFTKIVLHIVLQWWQRIYFKTLLPRIHAIKLPGNDIAEQFWSTGEAETSYKW